MSAAPDITVLVERLGLAFEKQKCHPSEFRLLAASRAAGTYIWWRDYHARKQRLLGHVANDAAVPVLTVLLDALEAMRRRKAA